MPQYIVVFIVYMYSYTLYIGKIFFEIFEFYDFYTGLYIRQAVPACIGRHGHAWIQADPPI